MLIKEIKSKDKKKFNQLASHPLQSWEWGEFRKKTGIEILRLGKYLNNKLVETAQITFHPVPLTNFKIGYFPKGNLPSKEMLNKLYEIGKEKKCIFIKIEPNVIKEDHKLDNYFLKKNVVSSPHPLFSKFSFQLDLNQSEEELLKKMHPKTRYNIKVAQKHNVKIAFDYSDKAFEIYLKLLSLTTKRQKFYAHSQKYHRLMWKTLRPAGIAHLISAVYYDKNKTQTLAAWIVFLFNNKLYYPYGGSSGKYKNLMASNLLMWEAIRFGKRKGATIFDMWGALGPKASIQDPWYGFHRFKQGYAPKLVEFIGSYDLIINPLLYRIYNLIFFIRQTALKVRIHLK